VSASAAGTQGNLESEDGSISADGRFVAFSSSATNLVPNDANSTWADIFVKDLQFGTVTLASATAGGMQAEGDSTSPSISADGRFIAFESNATELLPGLDPIFPGGPPFSVIFVKDLETGELVLASATATGSPAIGSSLEASISADGRFVAFSSDAANLVPGGDTNGSATDVFVKNLQTGELTLASATAAGRQGNGFTDQPSISADGRFVAFRSGSTNLVPGGDTTPGVSDVLVKDLQTGELILVSATAMGTQADEESSEPSISAGGRFVVFTSDAGNLLPAPDRNGIFLAPDVFVKDLWTGALTLVSASASGLQGNRFSTAIGDRLISDDGHFVAFTSAATDLDPAGDANGTIPDVFVKDLRTGEVALASVSTAGVQGKASSFADSISADGRFVAFTSGAAELLPDGDANLPFNTDVFVRDVNGDLTFA
jgi:Tol biopolymer transport system component